MLPYSFEEWCARLMRWHTYIDGMFSALQALPPTMFTYPNPWQPTAGNAVMPLYYGAIRPPKQPMPLSQQCGWSFQFYCVPRSKVEKAGAETIWAAAGRAAHVESEMAAKRRLLPERQLPVDRACKAPCRRALVSPRQSARTRR